MELLARIAYKTFANFAELDLKWTPEDEEDDDAMARADLAEEREGEAVETRFLAPNLWTDGEKANELQFPPGAFSNGAVYPAPSKKRPPTKTVWNSLLNAFIRTDLTAPIKKLILNSLP